MENGDFHCLKIKTRLNFIRRKGEKVLKRMAKLNTITDPRRIRDNSENTVNILDIQEKLPEH